MSGACASEAAERVAAAKIAAKIKAKAAPKCRGRQRNADRPRIDIDDDIESANELNVMMKKLAHAAKMQQRNSLRCKARLVKKCGKMSVQDLERLAVLKRCGLLVQDDADDLPTASSSASTVSLTGTPPKKRRSSVEMLKKLADVVSKSGGEDVMSCVRDLQDMLEREDEQRARAVSLAASTKHTTPAVGTTTTGSGPHEEQGVLVTATSTTSEAGDEKHEAEEED